MKNALLICGPTASGKSQLAHHLAKAHNGEIVNCDSMQIYNETSIITASPNANDIEEVQYHLYNFISITENFTVIKYLKLAVEKIREISSRNKLPIIVGGSGLYVSSLLYGYNQIPEIDLIIKRNAKILQNELGQIEFFEHLKNLDPIAGLRLNQNDKQRSLRAYEVWQQTRQSIFTFQQLDNILPLPEFNINVTFLNPEREQLYQTCNNRLEKIFNNGAIEEVQRLKTTLKPHHLNSIKPIGVQEILAYLNEDISLPQALALAQAKTRQYAKRQITWFKNQLKESKLIVLHPMF